jgi:hypothetical protein
MRSLRSPGFSQGSGHYRRLGFFAHFNGMSLMSRLIKSIFVLLVVATLTSVLITALSEQPSRFSGRYDGLRGYDFSKKDAASGIGYLSDEPDPATSTLRYIGVQRALAPLLIRKDANCCSLVIGDFNKVGSLAGFNIEFDAGNGVFVLSRRR